MVLVLANTALLKAAPGIGDLKSYIKEVTDMLEANEIPVSNFKLAYESKPSSSSITLMKTEKCLDDGDETLAFQDVKSDASMLAPTELETTALSCLDYSDFSKVSDGELFTEPSPVQMPLSTHVLDSTLFFDSQEVQSDFSPIAPTGQETIVPSCEYLSDYSEISPLGSNSFPYPAQIFSSQKKTSTSPSFS